MSFIYEMVATFCFPNESVKNLQVFHRKSLYVSRADGYRQHLPELSFYKQSKKQHLQTKIQKNYFRSNSCQQ